MNDELEKRITAGKSIIKSQIDYFKQHWGRVQRTYKADHTHITPADLYLSETILNLIKKHFPEDQCFSEESSDANNPVPITSTYSWILDPIDGTNNYALGFPMCAISLALLREGTPVYGFIYDFSRNSIIDGGPAMGAWDAGKPIHVKDKAFDDESIVALHFPLKLDRLEGVQSLLNHRVRCLGSGTLNLAYTALGVTEGCIDYSLKIWDFAAAYAIILGAGGSFAFIEQPPFPLTSFTVNQSKMGIYAGSLAFCEYIRTHLSLD